LELHFDPAQLEFTYRGSPAAAPSNVMIQQASDSDAARCVERYIPLSSFEHGG